MTQFISTLVGIFQSSGFARFGEPGGYLYAIMICVGCFLLYLAIVFAEFSFGGTQSTVDLMKQVIDLEQDAKNISA